MKKKDTTIKPLELSYKGKDYTINQPRPGHHGLLDPNEFLEIQATRVNGKYELRLLKDHATGNDQELNANLEIFWNQQKGTVDRIQFVSEGKYEGPTQGISSRVEVRTTALGALDFTIELVSGDRDLQTPKEFLEHMNTSDGQSPEDYLANLLEYSYGPLSKMNKDLQYEKGESFLKNAVEGFESFIEESITLLAKENQNRAKENPNQAEFLPDAVGIIKGLKEYVNASSYLKENDAKINAFLDKTLKSIESSANKPK